MDEGFANLSVARSRGLTHVRRPAPFVTPAYLRAPPMADVHHETIYFGGHVQGVGFRFQTLQVAKEFEVAGHVSNLSDGRVQVEVEGTSSEVDAFVAALEERMHGYIRKVERVALPQSRRFSGFSIR